MLSLVGTQTHLLNFLHNSTEMACQDMFTVLNICFHYSRQFTALRFQDQSYAKRWGRKNEREKKSSTPPPPKSSIKTGLPHLVAQKLLRRGKERKGKMEVVGEITTQNQESLL